MSNDNDGGPAFPIHPNTRSAPRQWECDGMSLRDYFAGQALASIPVRNWEHIGNDAETIKAWAECCYAAADAMLEARGTER